MTTGLVNHLRESLGLVTFKKGKSGGYEFSIQVGSILSGKNPPKTFKRMVPFPTMSTFKRCFRVPC